MERRTDKPAMVNLGYGLNWIEKYLENWKNTLLGVSVRVFSEAIGTWVENLGKFENLERVRFLLLPSFLDLRL
jgi:hypothetical protein